MPKRKIIEIDAELCDGCELCVSACHEGAIAIVDGKAKLVSDVYCDGLGACLGECPQGAIAIVERDADSFDAAAVAARLAAAQGRKVEAPARAGAARTAPMVVAPAGPPTGGCPGSLARMVDRARGPEATAGPAGGPQPSVLRNWPVQLHLVPVQAPYYEGATLLIAADCVPFAYGDFHRSMLADRTVIIGCPKLDDTSAYAEKLAAIFRFNDIEAIEVAIMEVPCCRGLARLVEQALEQSGKSLPFRLVKVGIRGDLLPIPERPMALPVATVRPLA